MHKMRMNCSIQSAANSNILDACLNKVFDAAPNGFILVDDRGAIVLANLRLLEMFGYSAEQILGKKIEFLLPERFHSHHPALRQEYVHKPMTRAMGSGRDLFALHADGHEFSVEIGLNPMETEQGNMILASIVDITERVRLEHSFRNIFEASPYGMLMVDADNKISMVNPRTGNIFGYEVQELVGQSIDMLIPERYRANHGKHISEYRAAPSIRMMGGNRDLTALHRDGTEIPVEIGLSPVSWRGEKKVLAAISDITLRKRMELALQQANSNLEEFSYVASHDLKSPLRGISDLVEWITDDLGNAASQTVQKNLERVAVRVKRMERMIEDLLSYARAGRKNTELSIVDIKKLIDGILEVQPLPTGFVIKQNISVTPFKTARVPLETVLRNLLSNAVNHHDKNVGVIEVEAEEDDSDCLIRIRDDGPGIPLKAHERVFKLFQTLTASERGGSGIGLAVSKRLVESHGGSITLQVEEGKRGVQFSVRWPRFIRRELDDSTTA